MIKLAVFLSMLLFVSNCLDDKTIIFSEKPHNEFISIIRLDDTIQISFKIDSAYRPIGPTIFGWGADGYSAFSNEIDTIHVLFYDLPSHKNFLFDSIEFKKNVSSKAKSIGNNIKSMNIVNYNDVVQISYNEIGSLNSEINYSIIYLNEKINIRIIYQTRKIDSHALLVFNEICKSVSFKIMPKNKSNNSNSRFGF